MNQENNPTTFTSPNHRQFYYIKFTDDSKLEGEIIAINGSGAPKYYADNPLIGEEDIILFNSSTHPHWKFTGGKLVPFTEEELAPILEFFNEEKRKVAYRQNRAMRYPLVEEQLDMLYKDIKSGNLENGSWITLIDAIKSDNPKPQ